MTVPRRTKQALEAQRQRELLDRETLRDLTALQARWRKRGIERLLAVSDEEWQAVLDADAEWEARQTITVEVAFKEQLTPWGQLVAHGSPVMKFAHGLNMRDETAEQTLQAELTAQRARAYEREMTVQGQQVGCEGYRAPLRIGPEWVALNQQSADDARSITNTYNKDLANQINKIRKDVPTANRHVYAKRINAWDAKRSTWKDKEINQWTNNSARGKAQADFYRNNGISEGTAVLYPRTGVCPVCVGWINRGEVPVSVALANPGPYHNFCPHYFNITTPKVPPEDCANLWRPGGPSGSIVPSVPTEPMVVEPPEASKEFARVRNPERWAEEHYQDWEYDLGRSERQAVIDYTGSLHSTVNAALRYDDANALNLYRRKIDALESALAKASTPEDITSYRCSKALTNSVADTKKLKGSIIQDKGFLSTSLDADIAISDFAEEISTGASPVLYEISVPAGTEGAAVRMLSTKPLEEEFLIRRNIRLLITDVTEETRAGKKLTKILAEIIP